MRLISLILANYAFILLSIVIFFTPFYSTYVKHRPAAARKRNVNRQIEDFFDSQQANWLVFCWAFGEALIWFVIPEFLLLLIIFLRVHRKKELLFFDIYGTVAGTLLAYVLDIPIRNIHLLPYIQPKMIVQTEVWYRHHGLLGLFYQPFSGVPYKVFTYLAPHYHFFILAFLCVAVMVRIVRYYIFFAIFGLIYPVFHPFVYRNYVRLFLVAVFVFSILLLRVYELYGASYHVSRVSWTPAKNAVILQINEVT